MGGIFFFLNSFYFREILNVGFVLIVVGIVGGERVGNRGDGGKERERFRWGRDWD